MLTKTWYKPQAHTRDEIIKAMTKKRDNLLIEAEMYNSGLLQIKTLHEKLFYEVVIKEKYTPSNFSTYFAQCWKLGRDHVEFRIYAICHNTLTHTTYPDKLSLPWGSYWSAIQVSHEDAPLYIGFPHKTPYFSKLLAKKVKI